MFVVHAVWQGGALCLWAEDSTGPATTRAPGTPRQHPYAVPSGSLATVLAVLAVGADDLAAKAAEGEIILELPGSATGPQSSPELGRGPARPRLVPWRIPVLCFDPSAVLDLLADLDTSDAAVLIGADLRYFAVVAAEAVAAVTHGRVLPSLAIEDGLYAGRWRPVLAGAQARRFRELAEAMPPVCRATGAASADVLLETLNALADSAVRRRLGGPLLAARRGGARRIPFAERWVDSLSGEDARAVAEDEEEAAEFGAALAGWFAEARRAGGGAATVCFRLAEPGPADEDTSDLAWRIDFSLQAADDPSLVVSAHDIWAGERLPGVPGRPDDALLAGLGRAARLWPALSAALRTARPASWTLETDQAFTFLKETAPLLRAAGFGVHLPAWAGKSRLGLKLTTRSTTSSSAAGGSSGFGLDQIVDFRWDLAIGDDTVDAEEIAELARLKVPLVRVRGQWVELDDRQLKAALDFMDATRREGRMTTAGVIREIVLGGVEDLPLVGVDADGRLADLLSGQADRRLEPVPTPESFAGTLRPYQERGLTWLSFLSDLGLGAVLADDMGLGKCVLPDMPVFVNGALIRAEELWNFHGDTVTWDGEGEWAEPARPLVTNAMDGSGRIVEALIVRLYRQRIHEKIRQIKLSDGSEVSITRRHRLLGTDDWTNDLTVGDRICVPSRLTWTGEPVDPDLATLLAWQISEGHEERRGQVKITQKDITVLERVRRCLVAAGRRLGLRTNRPAISMRRGVHDLRFNSIDYRRYLESRGYPWGVRSAEKRIPDFLMAADDATARLFLREFFSAEGSVIRKMRMIEISSASPLLMMQLGVLLRRFGIWLRVSEKMKGATNGTGIKRPYRIGIIGGPSLYIFRDEIGFSDPVKQAKLEDLRGVPINTNVEGIPGSDLLKQARELSKLPMAHFGVGSVYFTGTQELSKETAYAAVGAMDRVVFGEAALEYADRPRTKWSAGTLAAYETLDAAALGRIRDRLHDRVGREVFYPKIVEINDVDYDGYVYDFEVPQLHNYVAGNILCHNTAQTLALLAHERRDRQAEAKPTLLVGPMSLVGNWQREAAKFTPGLRVYVHHGGDRHKGEDLIAEIQKADLVITTYGTALRDREDLAEIDWGRIVCDEAQAIKNGATRQAKAVRSLAADSRIALTGTPVENHLGDLWSIMEFVNPGLLGTQADFRRRYAVPIERDADPEASAALRRATGPFVLRRLKTDKSIISDLPEKMEMTTYCNLTTEQASLYQATVEEMLDRIAHSEGIERKGLVLATMAKLKQVCNHPAHLLKDGSRLAGRSGKLARLEELLEEVLAEGDRALCFTQYSEFGSMLQPYLAARLGLPVLWLHGGTPKKRRDAMIEAFQSEDGPAVFLLSLKAAGTGLNLTAANHVIHIDRWWNPAVEDQATDRAFRIGQTKNVQVRKFVCVGTLEERIGEMIENKKKLAERIVGTGEDWLTDLSVAELRQVIELAPEAVTA